MNLGLYHLARQPLESLLESLRTVQRLTQQGKNEPTSAITGQMLTSGRQLLRSRPRFALNCLSVTEPAGDIVLTGEVSVPRLAQMDDEQLEQLLNHATGLESAFDYRFDASAKEEALQHLASVLGMQVPDIQQLVAQGIFVKEGE